MIRSILNVMNERFVFADRDQLLLLPCDLREWIPEDDFVNFVIEAVDNIPVDKFKTNLRGSGSRQYHPHLMLALLIYCYANGVFGSRRIERATHRDIAVRYLCANTHPDHDTICTFRRENYTAIAEAFLYVLKLARELKLLKVGTISVDTTKIRANASKAKSLRYDRACELEQQLKADIEELLKKAEVADERDSADSQKLPDEINRRAKLHEKMLKARTQLEAQAKARAAAERREYEKKIAQRKDRNHPGKPPKPPCADPRPQEQTNLTDKDSRLMRRSKQGEYMQAYNSHAVVDASGSQLILGARLSQCAGEHNELAVDVRSMPTTAGTPSRVLADTGFASEDDVAALESDGIEVLVPVDSEAQQNPRRYDFRPPKKQKNNKIKHGKYAKAWVGRMAEKMQTNKARSAYRLRKQTVEPVFGVIKHVMGFRQFLLRGLDKAELEWLLVATSYNFRRLFTLKAQLHPA